MTAFLTGLLALLSMGLMDRIRGGWPNGKRTKYTAHLCTSGAYMLMVSLVSTNPWMLFGGLLCGELAWRQDNGWRGRFVRGDGNLEDPIIWGLIWAVPGMIMGFWEPALFLLGIAVPFGALTAMLIACKLPAAKSFELRHCWPWSELLELPISGLYLLALAGITGL